MPTARHWWLGGFLARVRRVQTLILIAALRALLPCIVVHPPRLSCTVPTARHWWLYRWFSSTRTACTDFDRRSRGSPAVHRGTPVSSRGSASPAPWPRRGEDCVWALVGALPTDHRATLGSQSSPAPWPRRGEDCVWALVGALPTDHRATLVSQSSPALWLQPGRCQGAKTVLVASRSSPTVHRGTYTRLSVLSCTVATAWPMSRGEDCVQSCTGSGRSSPIVHRATPVSQSPPAL